MIKQLSASFVVTLCLLHLVATPAKSGDLYGVVKRPPAVQPKVAEVQRYRDLSAGIEETTDKECGCNPGLFSVITLFSTDPIPVAPLSDTLEMTQRNKMFEPSVLAVTVGSTVSFPNMDPFFHNVFSYSKSKKFDLGRYERGKTKYITFEKPGIIPVFCEIHYSMRAYIHVVETPYVTVSDKNGAFAIKNVPSGTYALQVWQEGHPPIETSISIKPDSTWLEIE